MGGGGRATGPGRARGAGARRALLLHSGAGLPRQDQRHDRPCRHSGWRRPRRLRPVRLGALGLGRASSWLRWPALRPRRMAVVSDLRTGLPGGPTRARGATARWPSSSRPKAAWPSVLGHAVGHRRIPRPLAGARRDRVAPVGGPVRRGGLPAPGAFGVRPGAGRGRLGARRRRPPDRRRAPRPRRGHPEEVSRGRRRTGGARPCRPDRQPRGGPGRPRAGRRARAGRRRAGGRGGGGGRRRRRRGPAHDRRTSRGPGGPTARPASRPVADAGRGTAARDLAYAVFLSWRGMLRREPPRRPDPERPDAPAMPAYRGVEVRLQRQPLHGVRLPPPAAHPDLPLLSVGRPDGAGADGRPPGDRGHLHHRPAGVQPLAPDGGGGHRFRRRWTVPGRDDRCRPRCRGRRHQGGDDLPAPLQRRGCTQLLLEGPTAVRR